MFSLIFAQFLLCVSCDSRNSSNDGNTSYEFKALQKNADKYKDPKIFIHYLDSGFRQISNPSVADRFRFYSANFVYYKKTAYAPRQELLYADSMLLMAEKTTDQKQYIANYAEANFAKGDALYDAKQYSDAYKCFYQGYFLGKNHLDNSLMAEYTYRMGMVMFRQAHFEQAANYFKESLKQSFSYTDDFRAFYQRQELLEDIGESYNNAGKIDSAELYYNKGLIYIIKNGGRFKDRSLLIDVARGVVYGNLGKMQNDKGNYAQAKELFKMSIAINLKKNADNFNAELVEIRLAQLYLRSNDNEAFSSLMNDIRKQLAVVKNEGAETDWNRLMSEYYLKKQDFANAIIYYKSYGALKDSLNKLAASLKETDVTQQLANYDKQYEIETLKDDNNLQLVYLYVAIICVTMAVVIIFLINKNLGRSKRDVLAISDLNKQIIQQKKGLEHTLNELKVSSQEKDRILRTVVHDLRNPIGGIVSLTRAMLDDEYTPDQKQLIGLVNGTSFNSLELINEILEATNRSGKQFNTEMVDINSLVNDSVEILNFKAAEKDQKIITELLAEPLKLLISRERIWRVISNLISNAIKFSPNGSTILVKVSQDVNGVNISVADNGIGIPDNIKDHVFDIFTDAKRSGTAGEKSFGLGLSICRQIMENHNGKIWFESDVAAGTTFHISLPTA